MLTLSRGGPIVWMSETDAKDLGIEDNDWIEVFNSNGALTARAVVSQRVPAGMTMMYHAQERIVNLPGSEITEQRGGIHNSVTRITPKPTHMIGGYAQLAYGFNYYGTVGSNRDEFVVVRKMKNINWLDGEGNDQVQESVKMKIRSQVGMVLNLDKCIGCHTCSVTCKNVWTSREGMEYAWFNNVESKPGTGFPTDWENQRSGRAAGSAKSTASCSRAWATARCCWVKSSLTRICRASTITTSRLTTTTRTCTTRRKASTSRSPVLAR